MDSLKFLLYTLGRIGVLIMVDILAVVTGKIFIPVLINFFPDDSAVTRFLLNESNRSVIGWAIMLVLLMWLFFDDGKRHAAYDIWNSVNIMIVHILMLMVYFVPTIFRAELDKENRGTVVYKMAYFPVLWLEERFDMAYTSAAALGIGIILVLAFSVYVVSYKLYMRKYKSLYKPMHSS